VIVKVLRFLHLTMHSDYIYDILSFTIDIKSIVIYTFLMSNKITNFGKWCRKIRIDRGWTMAETAKKLGCTQNNLTYIEQGKTSPSMKFLKKCIEVYEIPEAEKADFIAQALESSKRLILDLNKSKEIPKDYLAKIIAVLVFDLKEPYPDTPDWTAINQAVNTLKEYLRRRPKPFTIIQ